MAGALIEGLLSAGVYTPERITATDVRPERLVELSTRLGIETLTDNAEAARGADVVVLAIKPQVFAAALPEVAAGLRSDALVVSIAAGVSIASIERRLPPGARVVRTMPNTPALVDAGATAVAAGTHATAADVALVRRIFDSVGLTVALDEKLIDAVTGLSGSGPAYVFVVIEALSDAGVHVGLPRDTAAALAAQTVYGAAKLLIETGEHPGKLKDMVTSPGGTTIAGLRALEAGALRSALMEAVDRATARSRELGRIVAERLDAGPDAEA